ncbi:uncharacterized protein MONBRDRAFT_29060 [Monosiga brevicollis MX1]|uniref:EML-like first beta-propeller domain-containing protein n=1 Tax=Monosiga brevicollis TaxID=81824 RepID=A9VA01_MONBE|nr:uncharacterized protein MONBRDRAFT_29060 [Monosiga brevicollis MX1]EDQ85644.1 predicted protein [Monosiga brevicollis MX1]|eukprot:XP_001749593.1 hypothetical protein [Monosiga brevicollis MX1]
MAASPPAAPTTADLQQQILDLAEVIALQAKEVEGCHHQIKLLKTRISQLENANKVPSNRSSLRRPQTPASNTAALDADNSPNHEAAVERRPSTNRKLARIRSRNSRKNLAAELQDELPTLVINNHANVVHPPLDVEDLNTLDTSTPLNSLRLTRAYGYNGKLRHAVVYLPKTNEVAFPVGTLVVLIDPTTHEQRLYKEHRSQVQALALHPDGDVMASVGTITSLRNRPAIRFWDPDTLATLHTLEHDNLSGVALLQFSPVDPDILLVYQEQEQLLSLWDWRNHVPMIFQAMGGDVLSLHVNVTSNTIVTAGKRHLMFWTLSAQNDQTVTLAPKRAIFGKRDRPAAVLCAMTSPKGLTVTGDTSGAILVWTKPVPNHNISHLIENAHEGGVGALCATEQGFVSGGVKDGRVRLWAWTYDLFPVNDDEFNEMTVHGGVRALACVTVDGLPYLSDFFIGTSTNVVQSVDAGEGTVNTITRGHSSAVVAAAPQQEHFVTATRDGVVAIGYATGVVDLLAADGASLDDLMRDRQPADDCTTTLRLLAVGAEDGMVRIYQRAASVPGVHGPTYRPLDEKTHQVFADPIVGIDICDASQFLRIASAHTVTTRRISDMAEPSVETARALAWSTPAARICWQAAGAWAAVGNDAAVLGPVALRVDSGMPLLASGDRTGTLRLYRYPAPEAAEAFIYAQHNKSITGLGFNRYVALSTPAGLGP